MTCCINLNFCLLKKLALHMLIMVKKGKKTAFLEIYPQQM